MLVVVLGTCGQKLPFPPVLSLPPSCASAGALLPIPGWRPKPRDFTGAILDDIGTLPREGSAPSLERVVVAATPARSA